MAGSITSSLPIAMRMVGDAIRLDSQNCKKEAYCQYLSCCVYISQTLKDDAWNKEINLVYDKDAAKLFKLIQQCQERALTIISEGVNAAGSSSSGLPHPQLSHSLPTPLHDNVRNISDSSLPSRDMGRPTQGHVRTSSGSLLNFPSPPSSMSHGNVGSNSLRPTNRVNYHQDSRTIGHHLRVTKLKTTNTDKTLTSIRRMSENLVIAKAREEAIRKKVWERQQRLQEEANRRFASAVAASQEEQEQRALYTKILEYEQDMVWPRQLREKLKQRPEDTALINDIINKIFSSKDHPLRHFLLQYQYHVYKKLLPLLKDVNFPDGKHLKKSSNTSAAHDQKDTKNVCPMSKDTSSEVNNLEEKKSELCSKYTEQDEGSCSPDNQGKIVKNMNMEKPDKLNDKNGDNIIANLESKYDEDEISKMNEHMEEPEELVTDNSEFLNNVNNISTITDANQDKINEKTSNYEKGENGCCNDTKSSESAIETDIKDDISSIVNYIIEYILDEIEKTDPGTIDVIDETKKACMNTENSEIEDAIIDKSERIIDTDDTGMACEEFDKNPSSSKENISDQIITDKTKIPNFDQDRHKDKKILRIESFDVESEFESLENDMFDSESNDDETDEDPGRVEEEPNSDETAEIADARSKVEDHPIPTNEGSSSTETTQENYTNVVDQNTDTNQEQVEEDLELTRKQLNEIFVDMRFFLEKLKGFIILAYEELATPVGHDQCYAAVEFPFFQPLWPLLLGVLRRLNFDKEMSLGCVMTKRIRGLPAEMGVVDRLCLSDQSSLPGNQYPYQPAVEQLHKVATSYCPLVKLDFIVRVLRSICHCVEDYWESKGKPRHCPETSIGCDDLLPVLCYVIVRSGMAQLVSECSAMEEFIPEGYLMGEEGYCLTTLQTALAYLISQE